MGRLIDADTLIETIKKYKFGAISNDTEREYIKETALNFINEQPIAYSVEKVVAELEEASHWEESTVDEDGYSNDDSEEVVYLNEAISIVKRGGVE